MKFVLFDSHSAWDCPPGQVFRECVCPEEDPYRTCSDWDHGGHIDCHTDPVDGCFCATGTYLDEFGNCAPCREYTGPWYELYQLPNYGWKIVMMEEIQ